MDEITMKDLFQAIHDLSVDVKNVQTEVKDIKSNVKSLQTGIKDIKSEIKDIRTEMKDMKNELKQDIRRVDKKFSIVLEDLLEAKTDISILQRAIN